MSGILTVYAAHIATSLTARYGQRKESLVYTCTVWRTVCTRFSFLLCTHKKTDPGNEVNNFAVLSLACLCMPVHACACLYKPPDKDLDTLYSGCHAGFRPLLEFNCSNTLVYYISLMFDTCTGMYKAVLTCA